MNNDKNEPLGDATPVEEQIVSLEPDEIDDLDLTEVSGGTPSTHKVTQTCSSTCSLVTCG